MDLSVLTIIIIHMLYKIKVIGLNVLSFFNNL